MHWPYVVINSMFARGDGNVKTTLCKAFSRTTYTCSLWTSYTKKTVHALRVQYNNGFRMLLGLPRICTALGMFAKARTDSFSAMIRKDTISLMSRVRDSSNSSMFLIWEYSACAMWKQWSSVHMGSRGFISNIM